MFKNYIKISIRNIISQKGYSFINIFGLAIGIACCILILIYVQYELSFDKYHKKSDRIYRIVIRGQMSGTTINSAMTPARWAPLLRNDYPEIESFVRFRPPLSRWLLTYKDKKFYEKGFIFADSTVFKVFDFELLRGNPSAALSKPYTVVLTEAMAQKYFGNEDPIGKMLLLDNTYNLEVTGIIEEVPSNSHFTFDFLASFETLFKEPIYGGINGIMNPMIYTYLLFRDGASPGEFENKLSGFTEKYLGNFLRQVSAELNLIPQPLTDIHLHSHYDAEIETNNDTQTILILLSIASFILIIASINFMNLATARFANRAREVGMRKVSGAHRSQLVYQFLGESLITTVIALIVALFLVKVNLPHFNNLSGMNLSFLFILKPSIITGILFITLFIGLVVGSYPAFYLASFKSADILKGTLKASTKNAFLRKILVTVQFTVSIFMIIGTGIIYNQLEYIRNKPLGFNKEGVVVMPLPDIAVRERMEALKTELLKDPAVVNVCASSSVPGSLTGFANVVPEGRTSDDAILVSSFRVTEGFFETLEIEVLQGRSFSKEFPSDVNQSVMLNETAAERIGWENPIGKRIEGFGPNYKPKVIGVVEDFHFKSLHQPIEPLIITMIGGDLLFASVKIKTDDTPTAINGIKNAWMKVNSDHVFEYSFLDEDYDSLYQAENRLVQIFGYFSALAIFIACLGLFGIASFTAEKRSKEIGIRKVLGASVLGINFLLSKEFLKLVLLANILSWPAAYFIMKRWLQNFAYNIDITVWMFIFAGLGAFVIALITVSFQTIKAANANPVDTIKYE